MKIKSILSLIIILFLVAFAEDKVAYQIYDAKGKAATYVKLLNDARQADIILFGELHNNPINHWLQLELTEDMYKIKKNNLILGAEMFEADDQIVLDEYLQGKISEKTFNDEVKLWPNYKTDYKPLLEFAKINKLYFIAANIPRRYANLVYSKGIEHLDSIDPEAKKWICPLPMKYDSTLKYYKEIHTMAAGHAGGNLPRSQAIKDATMAYFILKNWTKGKTVIHYNGSYHSNFYEGIVWYLKQENPDLKIVTIASAEQVTIDSLSQDNIGLADYIICTPASMTKTH